MRSKKNGLKKQTRFILCFPFFFKGVSLKRKRKEEDFNRKNKYFCFPKFGIPSPFVFKDQVEGVPNNNKEGIRA